MQIPELPVKPRFVVAIVGLLVIAFLMWQEVVRPSAGIAIIVAILAGAGVYHRMRGN